MKILIVEDERPAAERLTQLLADGSLDIEVVGKTESVEETINWLERYDVPDLILMDIQLDDGLCFEIFECIKLDAPIIFTTAYSDYMLRAFKVNSIDYLLKPIQSEDLMHAIEKYQRIHSGRSMNQQIEALLAGFEQSYRNRFLIKIGHYYQSVDVQNIQYFYIESKGTYIHTTEQKNYTLDVPLDQLSKMLDPDQFYRINRSCIINIKSIHRLCALSSSRLQLMIEGVDRKDLFVVSREKVKDFKRWVDR